MITADHGNDPTYFGTDHTRETVPLLCYGTSLKHPRQLEEQETFGVIGATIADNFQVELLPHMIGNSLLDQIK